ncbi:glutamate cyclase domain-containing protein [Micromonospora sp. NPDC005197]|uniref:glutamate cyclase domain-containing protein n=1 Tax=Micromonospora sp. NPDC005197 TaxID=3157020 RepID=UPI0033B3A9D0
MVATLQRRSWIPHAPTAGPREQLSGCSARPFRPDSTSTVSETIPPFHRCFAQRQRPTATRSAASPGPVTLVPSTVAGEARGDEWADALLPRYGRLTHLIACERVGPGMDGRPRNMRGEDIGAHTAPLDRLYRAGSAFRIGIGDGGNELGMGLLPAELVGRVVASGERIRCVVGADALLVGGTSNWAAAALVGALSLLRPEVPELRTLLEPAWSSDLLTAIVSAGAVDGVRRRPTRSVDGLDWPAYAEPLAQIADLVRSAR